MLLLKYYLLKMHYKWPYLRAVAIRKSAAVVTAAKAHTALT